LLTRWAKSREFTDGELNEVPVDGKIILRYYSLVLIVTVIVVRAIAREAAGDQSVDVSGKPRFRNKNVVEEL
jgi:hypothetical protein